MEAEENRKRDSDWWDEFTKKEKAKYEEMRRLYPDASYFYYKMKKVTPKTQEN